MVVRATMVDIIARVRLLVNDQGVTPVFSDSQLQDTLDQRRADIRYLGLIPAETISGPPTQGVVTWLDFYAPDGMGWWEGDAQIVSNVFAPLTPATSDFIVGHWTFAVSQLPPCYIVGKTFDLYAAAADTLEQWVALLKLEYDTRQNRLDMFQRSQRIDHMTALAATYRAKQRPATATLVRDDTHPGSEVNFYLRPWSSR
jgi:hypothetical protein